MGYYPRFPVAIPLWRVGQVRVTHPSAAPYPPFRRIAGRSLDLHVLGAPPAFVLSRDQTLHDILLYHRPHGLSFLSMESSIPKLLYHLRSTAVPNTFTGYPSLPFPFVPCLVAFPLSRRAFLQAGNSKYTKFLHYVNHVYLYTFS